MEKDETLYARLDELLTDENPQDDYNLKFDKPDLSKILFNENNQPKSFNEKQERFLAKILCRSNMDDKTINDLIDYADKFPNLFGEVNQISGTSVRGYLYDKLHQELEKRDFVSSLPAVYAILATNQSVWFVGEGDVTSLDAKKRSYLDKIFKLSQASTGRYENTATSFLERNVDNLLNYEQASSDFRNFINSHVNSTKQLDRLKIDFYTPELLAKILEKRWVHAKRPEKLDTSKAKTQKEKNVNILPSYYLKTRDALLSLAEKENPHDPKKYGELKSLTQRYKELCVRLVKVKDWSMIPEDIKNGVMKDGLLIAAQKDIINGNAAKLDKQDIEMVLAKDKNNFYIRKIPSNVLSDKQVASDKAAWFALSDEDKMQRIDYLVDNKNYTAKDKEELLATVEKQVEKDKPRKEQYESLIADYKQDKIIYNQKVEASANTRWSADYIKKLQQAAESIGRYFKDGNANEQESHLTKEAMEKFLAGYVAGEKSSLPMPEYKSLPLFMGRKAEEQRRISVRTAVSQFNDLIHGVPKDKKELLKLYEGSFLSEESLNKANEKAQQSWQDVSDFKSNFDEKYRQLTDVERAHPILEANDARFETAKQKLKTHKKVLQSVVDEHLGKNETELKATTNTMSCAEKHDVRAHNAAVKDTLAEREKLLYGKTCKEKVSMTLEQIKGQIR